MNGIPDITCAICRKPVDEVIVCERPDIDGYEFRVSCHGDSDICVLTSEYLNITRKMPETGVAFTTKRMKSTAHIEPRKQEQGEG